MPASVFVVGCTLGTESFSLQTAGNMVVVTTGVAIASYGEINFVVIGVVLQLIAIVAEATRLSLVQACPMRLWNPHHAWSARSRVDA